MIFTISKRIATSVKINESVAQSTDEKSIVPVENNAEIAVAIESAKFKICIAYFKKLVALL